MVFLEGASIDVVTLLPVGEKSKQPGSNCSSKPTESNSLITSSPSSMGVRAVDLSRFRNVFKELLNYFFGQIYI